MQCFANGEALFICLLNLCTDPDRNMTNRRDYLRSKVLLMKDLEQSLRVNAEKEKIINQLLKQKGNDIDMALFISKHDRENRALYAELVDR